MNPVPQDGTQADEQPADVQTVDLVQDTPVEAVMPPDDAPPTPEPTPVKAPPPPGPAWVRWDAPPGAAEPLYAAGRYWFGGTHYHLSEADAAALDDTPGFVRE